MSDPIYLIRDDNQGGAIRLEAKPYAKEEEFQLLLERFPELLAGEQVEPDDPRRWLLVAREIGVPDSEESGPRWSLDHFFVDQDGIPTLVEVKRQSDTRLRREVVGQMLDYAANAARFWPASFLAAEFEKTCKKSSLEPDAVLRAFLQTQDIDPGAFWPAVEARLRDGEMRLIFFADEVPKELRRIVEFLNSQTTKTEVLAVEVRRYAGGGYSTHVPQLIGQTTEAEAAKTATRAGSQRRKWDASQFFAACAELPGEVQAVLRQAHALAGQSGFGLKWGTGSVTGSLNLVIPAICPRSIVSFHTDGRLTMNFGWLPESTRDALAGFAKANLGVELKPGWDADWYPVPHADWVARWEAVSAFLKARAAAAAGGNPAP